MHSLQANVDLRSNQRGLETIVGKLMVGISKLEREREALKGSLDRAMEVAEAKAEVRRGTGQG